MIEGWIQTFSGKKFRPLAADPADVDIRDIAHALALKCRFNGHCRSFYSVAEHSVRVSQCLEASAADKPTCLAGLMHDAAEAYLADLGSPLKKSFHVRPLGAAAKGESFADAEDRLLAVIAAALHFPPISYDAVREADLRLLVTEARDLMGGQVASWEVDVPPLEKKIIPVAWQEAEGMFLARWEELRPRIAAKPSA